MYFNAEHILTVFFQHLLCRLVLHDGSTPDIEIIGVRVAEPIGDIHVDLQRVMFFACGMKSLFKRNFDLEIVLLKLCQIFILSNAEMHVYR